jgi:hypothetical protein
MGEQNVIINFEFDPKTTRFQPWDLREQEDFNSYRVNELDQENDF